MSPDSALNYVACQTPPGLPSHTLAVKVNGVYCLLWNFSLDRGLVKNVCVVVVDVGTQIVTVRLFRPGDLTNNEGEEDILIPRISFLYQQLMQLLLTPFKALPLMLLELIPHGLCSHMVSFILPFHT
jgi:hypothetical protein